MRKLLPIILALVGIGGGIGAGLLLKPAPQVETALAENCATPAADAHAETAPDVAQEDGHGDAAHGDDEHGGPEYVKLNNQFVIPVIGEGQVSALVVLSLSLEVSAGNSDAVFKREPKLRDSFLQVLFDHANVGGFEGAFTESNKLDPLRRVLLSAAQDTLGKMVSDVLITEIARQDS